MNRSALNSIFDASVRVGTLFAVPIRLHITILFFLLPVFRGWSASPLLGLEYAIGVVLSILIHELGHALMAKRLGLRGLSIMLHGFGGFATSEGPRTPELSIKISLAGPAASLALGLLLYVPLQLLVNPQNFLDPGLGEQLWILRALGWMNLLLAALNMLPMLPLDGGNTLAALLWRKFTFVKANRHVAHLGLVLGVVVIVTALSSPSLQLLSFFGFIGLVGSVTMLLQSGGIRFGEYFQDRREARELRAVKLREAAREEAFLDDVRKREKEREERERLRKLLEG